MSAKMTKEYIEQILVEYGVSFTSALAERLLKEFEAEPKLMPCRLTEWIPYSQEPKEYNKRWLCCNKEGDMAVGTYTSFGWCFGHYFDIPVAYMPLPEPYKEIEYEQSTT